LACVREVGGSTVIAHAYVPHPVWKRDQCEFKYDDDGRAGFCGKPRSEHMDETHALKIQLATALKERDTEKAARWELEKERGQVNGALKAELDETTRLRTALIEVNDLLMSVPAGEDWRARVRKKVVVALFGEAAWKET
jgi:hypothetical protein